MKITYDPFKEMIIKDIVKFENLDDLLYMFAQLRASGQPVALNWADGVVFIHAPLPPNTDELMEDFLKGRIYVVGVNFALMDEYQSFLVYKSKQGEVPVPILNVSSSQMLSELAKWLKTRSWHSIS